MREELVKEWRPKTGPARALAAEAIGTCVLVLASSGAGSSFGVFGGVVGGVQAALAPGLTLLALLLVFGPVSQGHFNPAVSLGMALAGRIPKSLALPYAVAQCIGALAAGIILRVLLHSSLLGVSSTQMNPLAALLLEAVLTFWLTWVYLAMTEREVPQLNAALGPAAALAGGIFWAGPLSSASMNPARSLGPALASWDLSGLWIYLIGPVVGGAAAALAYQKFKKLGT